MTRLELNRIAETRAKEICDGKYELRNDEGLRDFYVGVDIKNPGRVMLYGYLKLRESDNKTVQLIIKFLKTEIKNADYVELGLLDSVNSLYVVNHHIPQIMRNDSKFEVKFRMVPEKKYPTSKNVSDAILENELAHEESLKRIEEEYVVSRQQSEQKSA